jgi:hypothetical protein
LVSLPGFALPPLARLRDNPLMRLHLITPVPLRRRSSSPSPDVV